MAEQQTVSKVNGIDLDVLQDAVHAIELNPELGKCRFRASNKWMSGTHNRTRIVDFFGAKQEMRHKQPFEFEADEPSAFGGDDTAPNPIEYFLGALAGGLTTTMVAHAALHGIHVEELESEVEGELDMRGLFGLSVDIPRGFTRMRITFRVKADTRDMERLKRLAEYSPVLNTITHGVRVDVQVEPK